MNIMQNWEDSNLQVSNTQMLNSSASVKIADLGNDSNTSSSKFETQGNFSLPVSF